MDYSHLIAPSDFKAHFNPDITDEQYHADRTCIGSSQLKLILQSPKAFYHNFFVGQEREETEAFRIGKIVHTAILEGEKFRENYIVAPDFGDLRLKVNRETKKKWHEDLAPNRIVLSKEDFNNVIGIVDSVLSHPQSRGLFAQGKPEVAGYFSDPKTGIKLKFKPDFLSHDGNSLLDVKTAKFADRDRFMTSVFSFRYDCQLWLYSKGIEAITGKMPELRTILAVEKKPPFECAMYYFNDFSLEQAAVDYRRALDTLYACLVSNKWPQRQQVIEPAKIPNWFINRIVEGEENG